MWVTSVGTLGFSASRRAQDVPQLPTAAHLNAQPLAQSEFSTAL